MYISISFQPGTTPSRNNPIPSWKCSSPSPPWEADPRPCVQHIVTTWRCKVEKAGCSQSKSNMDVIWVIWRSVCLILDSLYHWWSFNDLNLVLWLMWPVISNQIEIENSGVLMSALYSIECFFDTFNCGLCWLVSLSVKMVDLSIWSRCFCQHPWNFGVRTRLRDSVQRCTEGSDIGHIGHIGHNDIGPRIARGFGRFQP